MSLQINLASSSLLPTNFHPMLPYPKIIYLRSPHSLKSNAESFSWRLHYNSNFSTGGAKGQTSCQSCSAGFYGNGETCTACPEDTFVSSWNSEVATEGQCQACRSGYSTNGATGAAECHCKFPSISNVLVRPLEINYLFWASTSIAFPYSVLKTHTSCSVFFLCVCVFFPRLLVQMGKFSSSKQIIYFKWPDVLIWHHYQHWEALIGNDRHWAIINIGGYFRSVLEFWSALGNGSMIDKR